MPRPTLFGMQLPAGPMCCGRETMLFRQEPVAGDERRIRRHFRCGLCHEVSAVITSDDDQPVRSPGIPFCPHCGRVIDARYGEK